MEQDKELATFRRELPRMLESHTGEYALIHGDQVAGFYPSDEEAYDAGVERFGLGAFLIMLVVEKERPLKLYIDIPRDA